MTKAKTAPAWRRAFLRELGRSGSVTLAAEKCGIDRATAYQMRKANAAFAKSWERAVEGARERLSFETAGPEKREGPSRRAFEKPLRGSSVAPQDERRRREPLRLRGDEVIRSFKAGRVCIARAGPGRWSAKSEAAFLAELTASANVTAAARAAGVSTQAAYNRRRLWPEFAAQWNAAVAEGFARIEMLLVCAATNTLDPEPLPERANEGPEMSMELAFNLYKLHRASQRGGKPQRYGWRRQEPSIEEVRAEILRKVAVLEKARESAGDARQPGQPPPKASQT